MSTFYYVSEFNLRQQPNATAGSWICIKVASYLTFTLDVRIPVDYSCTSRPLYVYDHKVSTCSHCGFRI